MVKQMLAKDLLCPIAGRPALWRGRGRGAQRLLANRSSLRTSFWEQFFI